MVKGVNDDYLLWKQVKAGEVDAFNKLYQEFADKLFSFGTVYTKDREAIKDCIHDLFFELYKYRKNLADTDNIKNYLFRSLKRKIQTNNRRAGSFIFSETVQELNDRLKETSMSLPDSLDDEKTRKIEIEINKLPERQKEALILRFRAEMEYDEIAKTMDISIESVRTLVYRSVKTLRYKLVPGEEKDSIILFTLKMLFHRYVSR